MDDEKTEQEQLEQSGAGDYGGAPGETAEESGRTAEPVEDAPPEGGDGSEG